MESFEGIELSGALPQRRSARPATRPETMRASSTRLERLEGASPTPAPGPRFRSVASLTS